MRGVRVRTLGGRTKESRYTEEQIIGILKKQEAGTPVAELCHKHGMSDATFYAWRSKYGGLEVSEARLELWGRKTPT